MKKIKIAILALSVLCGRYALGADVQMNLTFPGIAPASQPSVGSYPACGAAQAYSESTGFVYVYGGRCMTQVLSWIGSSQMADSLRTAVSACRVTSAADVFYDGACVDNAKFIGNDGVSFGLWEAVRAYTNERSRSHQN